MKTILLALLAILLWVGVEAAAFDAWDSEAAYHEAVDTCLLGGGIPADCLAVHP